MRGIICTLCMSLILSVSQLALAETSSSKSSAKKKSSVTSTQKKASKKSQPSKPKPKAKSSPAPVSVPTASVTKSPPRPVDCHYQMSGQSISDNELSVWAQYAALRSFDYSYDKIDNQLQNLKPCFTEQGWVGFNDALKQSGNLNIIKAQQLTVSSQLSGTPAISTVKPNQWRIVVPVDVVYQNKQEKLSQSLSVVLVITKKSPTTLGIVQLIAAPKPSKTVAAKAGAA